MSHIAIISSGYFPVPAVKGGAVETLIERLIISNERNPLHEFEIFSTYDEDAKAACNYMHTKVTYIPDNFLLECADKALYTLVKLVIRGDKQMSFRYIMHRIRYIICVARILALNDYDYVVIENTATLFWCIKLFGNNKKYRGKVLYHVHNTVDNAFGCEKLISQARFILGISEYINDTLKNRFSEIPSNRFRILYNCIDQKQLMKSAENGRQIREKYAVSNDAVLYLFVGRLCKDKGIEELIDAFAQMKNDRAMLMIVGNYYFGTSLISSFEKKLYDKIETCKENVIFTGFIPNGEIGAYYNAADVVVLPSVWEEPAGLTIIESMMASSGVTITTNSGGIPEYAGSENAIILDKNAANFVTLLSDKMKEVYNDQNCRQEYSKRAKIRANIFDYTDYIENFDMCIKD